jgi:hypothetical protein
MNTIFAILLGSIQHSYSFFYSYSFLFQVYLFLLKFPSSLYEPAPISESDDLYVSLMFLFLRRNLIPSIFILLLRIDCLPYSSPIQDIFSKV